MKYILANIRKICKINVWISHANNLLFRTTHTWTVSSGRRRPLVCHLSLFTFYVYSKEGIKKYQQLQTTTPSLFFTFYYGSWENKVWRKKSYYDFFISSLMLGLENVGVAAFHKRLARKHCIAITPWERERERERCVSVCHSSVAVSPSAPPPPPPRHLWKGSCVVGLSRWKRRSVRSYCVVAVLRIIVARLLKID